MPGSINADTRAEKDMIAYCHLTDIDNDAVIVRIKIVADANVAAIITAKWRLNKDMFTCRLKEIL